MLKLELHKLLNYLLKNAKLRVIVLQIIRKNLSDPGKDIFAYFECYFSQSVIPDLGVLNADFDIVKVRNDLYHNLAFFEYKNGPNDEDKFTAVMSYLYECNYS